MAFSGFDLSDFFAIAGVDSLAVVAFADELLAKSQEGGPAFGVDIRLGARAALEFGAAAANGREGENRGVEVGRRARGTIV